MFQAEDYQSLKSQGIICLQLILKSHGWDWLTVTLFPMVYRYLIDWLQLLSGVKLTMFTIRRPPAGIFGAPTRYKNITVSKILVKVATFFVIFFPHHRTLVWPTYGAFLQLTLFRNFGAAFSWHPRRRRGNRGYVTPLKLLSMEFVE